MADRLTIYNSALALLGQQRIASLTEVNPSRYALDGAWQKTGDLLLESGLWNFALRTVELSNDEDVEALFGYEKAFSKPEDWVRTANISQFPGFDMELADFADEPGYWYAGCDPLYVRYVSNDVDYGWNVGAWRQTFAQAFEAKLAFECGLPMTGDRGNRNDMLPLYKERLRNAKTKDAVDERVQFRPQGRLVNARYGARNSGRQSDGSDLI